MCGISGIIFFDNKAGKITMPLINMNSAQRHRGPDDEGYMLLSENTPNIFKGDETKAQPDFGNPVTYYPKEHIDTAAEKNWSMGFGFRRLSIIDLSIKGHQPMSYKDRYWMVFNGEIYNYLEIREELKKKNYFFETNSDSEVLLAAYDFWGKDCLQYFNGMWAFVIYDTLEKKVFMSRDRYGIKPLVFYIDHEKLLFASEIKSILKSGMVETSPNLTYLNFLFTTDGWEYGSETSFTGIFRFPHACYFETKLDNLDLNHFKPVKFYDIPVNISHEPVNNRQISFYVEEYLNLLEDSVKLRLRADVPIGTCLSGGMDSTSVVWFINKILKSQNSSKRQKTFSLVFDSDVRTHYADESRFIDDLVNSLNLNSSKVMPSSDNVMDMYYKTIYTMDNPQVSSLMSYMFTYKLVKEGGVTITLDGQGADEQQVGYLVYLMNHFSNQSLFKSLKERSLYNKENEYYRNYILGVIFKILRITGLKDYTKAILLMNNKFTDPFINLNGRLYNDLNGNLINLFHYGDRASMAFSIESRFPMMDYRLVDFWMKMPVSYKIHNGSTKFIARMAMNGKLPDTIVWRRDKMGWETPQKIWFRKDLREWFDSNIINSLFLLDSQIMSKEGLKSLVLKENLNNKEFKRLITLHNIALWYKTFFEKTLPAE
jgi:asparagine synthase (glutamine-hydrolysing)